MKNLILTTITFLSLVLFAAFTIKSAESEKTNMTVENFEVPANVQSILDNSCLQCHGTDGKFKAKMKWNFDKMSEMDNSKLISKLSDIEDILTKGKMPPKKYMKKNPDHKLSKQDREALISWASSYAEKLTKN